MNNSLLITSIVMGLSASAHAVVVVSTDFTGRNVSSPPTVSNVTYVTNGLDLPYATTLSFSGVGSFFNTADAQGYAAPAQNPASWSTRINLNVSGQDIDLTSVVFNMQSFSNTGAAKMNGSGQNYDLRATLFQGAAQLDTQTLLARGADRDTFTADFTDLTDQVLLANQDYELELAIVNGASGNNVGINGFNIQGDLVAAIPEPASAALLGLGGLAFILRRRR